MAKAIARLRPEMLIQYPSCDTNVRERHVGWWDERSQSRYSNRKPMQLQDTQHEIQHGKSEKTATVLKLERVCTLRSEEINTVAAIRGPPRNSLTISITTNPCDAAKSVKFQSFLLFNGLSLLVTVTGMNSLRGAKNDARRAHKPTIPPARVLFLLYVALALES